MLDVMRMGNVYIAVSNPSPTTTTPRISSSSFLNIHTLIAHRTRSRSSQTWEQRNLESEEASASRVQ